jgi:hypothetical protein
MSVGSRAERVSDAIEPSDGGALWDEIKDKPQWPEPRTVVVQLSTQRAR